MLIEFNVKNFLSIRDRQTFTLVASSQTELEQNTFSFDESEILKNDYDKYYH